MNRFARNLGLTAPPQPPKPDATNHEGRPAYAEGLRQAIARVALTGVLADGYYTREDAQTQEFVSLCTLAAQQEPAFLLKAARVSRKANFKLFPKLAVAALLAKADAEAWALIEPQAVAILSTYSAGQLLELALVLKGRVYGSGLGSRAQRVLGRVLLGLREDRLEAMTISDREDVRRLLRLVHPKLGPQSAVIAGYALGDKPEARTVSQLAMEELKRGVDDEKAAGLISFHRLPFNAVKGVAGLGSRAWRAIREGMSTLQLLLNLKALDERGAVNPLHLQAQLDEVDITKTRLVPHDVLRPIAHAPHQFREALVRFLARLAGQPLPGLIGKKVGVALDVSGSMDGAIGSSAWSLAATLATPILASVPCEVVYFNTHAIPQGTNGAPYVKDCSPHAILHNLLSVRPGGGTSIGLALDRLTRDHPDLDVVFLFTDEQQNGNVNGYDVWWQHQHRHPRARLVVVNVSTTKWHLTPASDPSVTYIQSITPLIYEQFERFDEDAMAMIERVGATA